MALAGKIEAILDIVLSGSPDSGTAKHTVNESVRIDLTDGIGANQANNIFADDFTISGAGTQTYDLAGGITNALGSTLTFTAIKAILIENTGAAALTYGGGANPFLGFVGGATHTISIPVGGSLLLTDPSAAGQAVTAGTGDTITLSGTDAAGSIWIIGEA